MRELVGRVGLLVAVVLVGSAATVPGPALATGSEPRPRVVAVFYPLAWVAEQVGGQAVRVTNLTPPGAEPHDLELTTDDRDAIEDADLVIVMGEGFQPAIEDAARDRGGPTVVVLDEIGIPPGDRARDPHVWLDPVLMGRVVDAVEAGLAEVAPARARAFERRAARVRGELDALHGEFRTGLADCRRDLIVTAHESFGWLSRRYGLRQRGAAGIDPEAEPDPRRLGELADLAAREGVTTVFTEELVPPDVAETLAREAGGLRNEVLSPLEGLSRRDRRRGGDYVSVMQRNLTKLQRALGCR